MDYMEYILKSVELFQTYKTVYSNFNVQYDLLYYVLPVALIFIVLLYNKCIEKKSESVLLIKYVGLQSTITYSQGYERSQFIPWSCIQDVVINEVVHFQKILHILVVLTKNYKGQKRGVIPLFQNTQPKLKKLEEIYRAIRRLIMNEYLAEQKSSGDSAFLNTQQIEFTINKQ